MLTAKGYSLVESPKLSSLCRKGDQDETYFKFTMALHHQGERRPIHFDRQRITSSPFLFAPPNRRRVREGTPLFPLRIRPAQGDSARVQGHLRPSRVLRGGRLQRHMVGQSARPRAHHSCRSPRRRGKIKIDRNVQWKMSHCILVCRSKSSAKRR